MYKIESKAKEIAEKWRSEKQKQGIEDPYKFYRLNRVMILEDLEELYTLCKLEEFKNLS